MKNKILVSAISFGYGPIITALNVCREFKKKGIKMDFVGCTIALEQAKMTDFFENIYDIDTEAKESVEKLNAIFSQYKMGLFGENPEGCVIAKKNGMRVYYIDNLMWMWDEIPKRFENFDKYFISNVIPSKENFDRVGNNINNPVFVGPIREIDTTTFNEKNELLINIGGAASPMLDQKIINDFYQSILIDILDAAKKSNFEKITLCGGSTVINSLYLNNYKNLDVKTLSNDEYLEKLDESKYCIFASGLGNFSESIGKNKNMMFLPAVNYSQFLQIEFYKSIDFGFKYINWDDFPFFINIPKYVDENTGVNLVEQNIVNYMSGNYHNFVKQITNDFFLEKQDDYFKKRKEFVNQLEKNASKKIVDIIINENKGELI